MDTERKLRVGDRIESLDPEDAGAQGEVIEITFPHRITTIRWDDGLISYEDSERLVRFVEEVNPDAPCREHGCPRYRCDEVHS